MATKKKGFQSGFLDKVLGRIGRLDPEGLQKVVERLARERTFLETLFNAIEDGVLVVDEKGTILYYNQAITTLLGVQPGTGEGEPVTRYVPELDWQQLRSADSEGGQRVVRLEFEISYPETRYIRLYATPLDGDDKGASGMALILHDATEARQKTFEAIESERIEALTLLAASVAHEIGNPLNALHIHLQLMERSLRKMHRLDLAGEVGAEAEDIGERLDKYLGVAKGEIARLDYIVTQFLQAIRPTEPKLEPGSLNHVVEETVNLLHPEIENRGIRAEVELDGSIPQAPLDSGQIKQVLVNLVKNAIQAMTRGGVLTVQTGASDEGVWVKVSDTGGGIPQEKINRIFKPYFTTKKKGSGLGLMIVERIVRDHQGLIEVKSSQGRGTTFRIWLPLHERRPRMIAASAGN